MITQIIERDPYLSVHFMFQTAIHAANIQQNNGLAKINTDKYSDMEAINCNLDIGKSETVLLGLIKSDGCLLDGMHKVVYYDPKYDIWCLYESPNGNIMDSDCYYMKSDGRVIIDHADVE